MIPYDELERALARWKSRQASGAAAAVESEPNEATPDSEVAFAGAVPESLDGLPPPPDNTGEIDIGDEAVESYDEDR